MWSRDSILAVVTLALAACGGGSASADAGDPDAQVFDAGPPIDSQAPTSDAFVFNYDWSCVGQNPSGAQIPAMIHVLGQAYAPLEQNRALPGVSIIGYGAGDVQLATSSTDSGGNFDLAIPTSGAPVEGHLKFSLAGYVDTYMFPQDPLIADVSPLFVSVFDVYSRDHLLPSFALTQVQPGDGIVAVQVTDCAGNAVRDAEVIVDGADSNTRTLYISDATGLPDAALVRTSPRGTAIILNINPGARSIHFRHQLAPDNDALQPLNVTIYPDAISAGVMHP